MEVCRENTEWANTWIARANQQCRRCLLIGDSTTRAIRSKLEVLAWDFLAIDLFAASFTMEDSWFWKSLHDFFDTVKLKYDVIIIHYGFHHGWHKKCHSNVDDYKEFSGYYNKLVIEMKRCCSNVIVMAGADTFCEDELNEAYLAQRMEIVTRNEIAKKAAVDNEVEFLDLFTLMKEKGRGYSYKDWIHFEQRANAFIAYEILSFIRTCFKDMVCEADIVKEKLRSKFEFSGQKFMIYEDSDSIYWFLEYLDITDRISCILKLLPGSGYTYRVPVKELEMVSMEERKELPVLHENKSEEGLLKKFGYEYLHLFSKMYK